MTLAAAVVPAVLWVGDISFMQDEPRLLAKAWHANARHAIETRGLNGNFGVPYGPLPTQVYQLLLLVTHDPIRLAAIRAGACAGVTALGLIWLARSLRLNPWFATAVVLAPYLWNFQRILWDASFAIPIGVLAMAAYASFLRTGRGAPLLTTVACAVALAFVHPQDLPLLLPIAAHALWRHRPALARHYAGLAVILGVALALNVGYFRHVYYAVDWHARHGSLKTTYDNKPSRAASFLAPLRGGAILEGSRFARRDSRLTDHPQLVTAAAVGSWLAYPLVWLGIGASLAGVLTRRLRRRRGENPAAPPDPLDPLDPAIRAARDAILGIALAGLALQVVLYGVLRIPPEPQYFFGTFALHVLFAWAGVEALGRLRVGWLAVLVYGASVAYITIASAVHVHRVGYARNTFRPSLANQVRVARELNRYADQTVLTDVKVFQVHPQSIRSLRLLIPPPPGAPQPTSGRLIIRHRSGPAGDDSAIELAELAPGEPPPPDAEPLDVTPLPPDWQPARW